MASSALFVGEECVDQDAGNFGGSRFNFFALRLAAQKDFTIADAEGDFFTNVEFASVFVEANRASVAGRRSFSVGRAFGHGNAPFVPAKLTQGRKVASVAVFPAVEPSSLTAVANVPVE